jgi:hypothetical protein
MSAEALVLALTTVVRPTSLAAVVAMLSTQHPQRLLAIYVAAGLAFSLAVGTLVVVLLGGLHMTRGRHPRRVGPPRRSPGSGDVPFV